MSWQPNFPQGNVSFWNLTYGKPFVTVSPSSTPDGSDFGAFTQGTTTSGIQEALNSIANTGGTLRLQTGTYNVTSNITLPTPSTINGQMYSIVGNGVGVTKINMNNNSITNSLTSWGGDSSLKFGLDGVWINNVIINAPYMAIDWGYVRVSTSSFASSVGITLGGGGGPSFGHSIQSLEVYDYNTSQLATHLWFENIWIGRYFCGYFGSANKTNNMNDFLGVSTTIGSMDCFVAGGSGGIGLGSSAFIWNNQGSAGEGLTIFHLTLSGTGTVGKTIVFLGGSALPATRVHHLSWISSSPPPYVVGSSGFGLTGGDANTLQTLWITDYPAGWTITTPALPAGTGSTNAVTNNFAFPVRVYQPVSTALGTHIIDAYGTDNALPADPPEVFLAPRCKIYYATAVPASWKWFGGV
jgi:hypothetical protein